MLKPLTCACLLPIVTHSILVPGARAQLFGSSAARDIKHGAEVAQLVEQQIGLYSMPEAEAYIREVGGRLVAAANDARWNFSFHIVDQFEPNAFSIPGGGVYVSRGLLALVDREDELAGVLAHEIAHVTRRHSARQQREGIIPGLLSVPSRIVGGVVSEDLGALINAPVDLVGGAWLSQYSRRQEIEADEVGLATAAKAGYDPAALGDILARLDRDLASQTGQERSFSIFDSHPMTETRLKDIRQRAARLTPAARSGVAPDPVLLWKKLDGMWWGQNPEAGVFHQNQFLHPSLGFTITFPSGWKHRNTPRFVLSTHPRQEALLMLAVEERELDLQAAGEKLVRQMRGTAGLSPASALKTSIGQFPAYVVTYQQHSGLTAVSLRFAWVAMAGKTYQLIGRAPENDQEALRSAAFTLRPLTDLERATITGKRLRMVTARSGERLVDLGARSGNVWSPAYTALVNALDTEQVLRDGQWVKIARTEPAIPGAGPSGGGPRRATAKHRSPLTAAALPE